MLASIHELFVKKAGFQTENRFFYCSHLLTNGSAWLTKVSGHIARVFGAARWTGNFGLVQYKAPVSAFTVKNDANVVANLDSLYQIMPIKNSDAVANGYSYTQYKYSPVHSVGEFNRKFPTTKKALEILNTFAESIAKDHKGKGKVISVPGESFVIKNGELHIPDANTYESNIHFTQDLLFWLILWRLGGDPAPFGLKKLTADCAACTMLHLVGLDPTPPNERYVVRLRNAFYQNPKLFTYSTYNAEEFVFPFNTLLNKEYPLEKQIQVV